MSETQSESVADKGWASPPIPGAVLVFSKDTAQLRRVLLKTGEVQVLGRDDIGGVAVPDERVSRQHAEVRYENGRFELKDLGSRNGTALNGEKFEKATAQDGAVLRLGGTVLLLLDDVRPFLGGSLTNDQLVLGPKMRTVFDRAAMARASGMHLLIHGESGTGKELVAKKFHSSAEKPGPLVSVNCAAIPSTVAERLLFGAVKGAYSDAKANQEGYLQAADGGVLFLDEVAELDMSVQAKLLRAVETKEVLPLGASTPVKVSVQICAASHRELKDAVAAGTFRQDLYYRLAQVDARLPPLRERREEIPALMQFALGGKGSLHVSVVEAALLRPWPGNVRELLSEVKKAALLATEGVVRGEHLAPGAGLEGPDEKASDAKAGASAASEGSVTVEQVRAALAQHQGNVSAAARSLSLHRTQFYRLMKRYGVEGE